MSTHTPGPAVLVGDVLALLEHLSFEQSAQAIRQVLAQRDDLLAALKRLRAELFSEEENATDSFLAAVVATDAAIAKAEGRNDVR